MVIDGYVDPGADPEADDAEAYPASVTNVHEVRWHVLRTRLESVLARAEQTPDGEELARLAALAVALLERHRVNAKGQCPYCCSRRLWCRRRSRRCMVLPLVSWHLEQPRCWSTEPGS